MVSTDRSLTGKTVRPTIPDDTIGDDAIFPAQLGRAVVRIRSAHRPRLCDVERPLDQTSGGWDDASIAAARDVVSSFFLFYERPSLLPDGLAPTSTDGLHSRRPVE